MARNFVLILIVAPFLFFQQNCVHSTNTNSALEGNRLIRLSPDERSAIVFFFKKGVSTNEQSKFLNEVLSIELDNNRGTDLLPGMSSTFALTIKGFDGYGINFLRDSTEEQKLEVIRRLEASPIVYKIYRNAVPNEIDDL